MTWPIAFVLTLVIELPLYRALLRWSARVPDRTALPAAVVVNVVSHPLLWFVVQPGVAAVSTPGVGLLVAEVLVVVGEGWWMGRVAGDRVVGYATSVVANGASLAIGLLVNAAV